MYQLQADVMQKRIPARPSNMHYVCGLVFVVNASCLMPSDLDPLLLTRINFNSTMGIIS